MAFIPKPEKKGYRPISLLSCLLKVLEKMILRRLKWYLESKPILPPTQMGFRPLRSCTGLITITNHVHASFIRGEVTVAVFLDIQEAFDSVIPGTLAEDLKDIGIPAKMRRYIWILTSERENYFVMDGELGTQGYSTC